MKLSTGSVKLRTSIRNLRIRWEATKEEWTDRVSKEFEERHIEPLEAQVMSTLTGIDRFAQVLMKAEEECG